MTIQMRRLLVPVFLCLAVACLIEIPLGMTDIFGDEEILWDTLFRAIGAVPGLFYFYREDEAVRGIRTFHLRTGMVLFMIGTVMSLTFRILFAAVGIPGYEEETRSLFTGTLWLQVLVLLAASPLLEELFFRGVFYVRLKELISVRGAVLLSSVCFGLYHGNLSQGIYGFFMGIALAWAMERCQTVMAPLMLHIGANAAALLLELVK